MLLIGALAYSAVIVAVFLLANRRATLLRAVSGRLHSTPLYHGLLAAMTAALAGLAVMIVASTSGLMSNPFNAALAAASALIAGLALSARSRPSSQTRSQFERIVLACLWGGSAVAVLATAGIFASVALESWIFFREISITDFLFGTEWAPTGSPPKFGFLPLLTGTLLITAIAILVATPLGLLSAIYMAEYASPAMRGVLKPVLEMLAGIPTVVLGFFAALTAAPAIRNIGEALGLSVASESALAAGLVMGMMIVPLISSLSDDIINAVPQSLRDGSYAMGATRSETIKRVVLPAALPGIVSAIMLAVSRAIGETMIVVMAAGLAANLSINPLAAVSTITVQIATLLVGDQEFDSAKTLSAFALGLVLFFVTLALNYVALRVVQKYREQYD
jgi:phosphate transport system permease protein